MTAHLIQTRANLRASYSILIDTQEQYRVDVPMKFQHYQADFFKDGTVLYHIRFDTIESIKNITRGTINAKRHPFTICNQNDEVIGHIYKKITKYLFGYVYFELQINGRLFHIYEVGMGKEGIKIPIYEGAQQIALIEKGTVVYDNKDEYELFALDSYYLEIAAVFAVYYDVIRFGNHGEVVYKTKEVNYLYSINKELKAKYDPAFRNMAERRT